MLYQLSYPPETDPKSGLLKIPKRPGRVNAIRERFERGRTAGFGYANGSGAIPEAGPDCLV